MEAIHIGTPLQVRWSFLHTDGTPFPIDEYTVDLYYYTGRGKTRVLDTGTITASGNVLTWRFDAEAQMNTGIYSLTLKASDGIKQIASFDRKDVFCLNSYGEQSDTPVVVNIVSFCDYISIGEAVEQVRHLVDRITTRLQRGAGEHSQGYKLLVTNRPLEEQVTAPNTIYEVCDGFDLGGETLTLPKNCQLLFNGGSFRNGTLDCNEGSLAYNPTYNIFNDTLILGLRTEFFDLRWFDDLTAAEGERLADCATAFDRCIATYSKNLTIPIRVIGSYRLSRRISSKKGIYIRNPSSAAWRPAGVEDYHIPSGGVRNPVGYIEVDFDDPNETIAFYVNATSGQTSNFAGDVFCSISGMQFRCPSGIPEVKFDSDGVPYYYRKWDDSIRTVTLLYYGVGRMPTHAMRFEQSLFEGFDKVFNFAGSTPGNVGPGTIASGILFEDLQFSHNSYAIYCNYAKVTEHNQTMNNMEIVRCHFNSNSKLHLEGLYGSNHIHLSVIEGIGKKELSIGEENPPVMYVTFGAIGHLKMDTMYLEDTYGDFIFEYNSSRLASKYYDNMAVVEIGELHRINDAASTTKYHFKFKNITLAKYPSLWQVAENARVGTYSMSLDACTVKEGCVENSNYGTITTGNIFLNAYEQQVEGGNPTTHKIGCVVLDSHHFHAIGKYQTVFQKPSSTTNRKRILRGWFSLGDNSHFTNWLDVEKRIRSVSFSNNVFPIDLVFEKNSTESDTFIDGEAYLINFWKRPGRFRVDFHSTLSTQESPDIIASVITPYNEGICMIKFLPGANISNMGKMTLTLLGFGVFDSGNMSDAAIIHIEHRGNTINHKDLSLELSAALPDIWNEAAYSGTSEERPDQNSRFPSLIYFDTDLGKPIWWNGSHWIDATGTVVD